MSWRATKRMMVYRCDRCGEYVESSMRGFFVRKPSKGVYRFGKKIHLCHECAESFTKWLHAPKSSEAAPKLLRNEVRNKMTSTNERTIWLVIDHGGAREDYWENVVCAFTKKNAASEYAEKRKEERKGKRDRTMDDNGDYSTTTVKSVTLVESGENRER